VSSSLYFTRFFPPPCATRNTTLISHSIARRPADLFPFPCHHHHLCNPSSSFKIPDRDAGITDQNRENPRTYPPSIRPIFDFIFFFFFGLAELLVMMKSSTHTREG
jgi:hypothetical protein